MFGRHGILVLAACGSEPTPTSTPPAIVVADAAAVDAPRPSPAIATPPPMMPDLQCAFRGALEGIQIHTDADTMIGTLRRSSPGRNHRREITYRAVARDREYDLVFLEYGKTDYPPIMNTRGPYAPRETMTKNKSIVATVRLVGDLSLIRGRAVDLHTEMMYQTKEHWYPCATPNAAFHAKHPNMFLPREPVTAP